MKKIEKNLINEKYGIVWYPNTASYPDTDSLCCFIFWMYAGNCS